MLPPQRRCKAPGSPVRTSDGVMAAEMQNAPVGGSPTRHVGLRAVVRQIHLSAGERDCRPATAPFRVSGELDGADACHGNPTAAHSLQPHRNRQAERRRSPNLAYMRSCPNRRPQDQQDRRATTVALRCSGSVTGIAMIAIGRVGRTVTFNLLVSLAKNLFMKLINSHPSPDVADASCRGPRLPCVGFIVTNLPMEPDWVVRFYNQRGTAEQHIKEGKQAINWTRLRTMILIMGAGLLTNGWYTIAFGSMKIDI